MDEDEFLQEDTNTEPEQPEPELTNTEPQIYTGPNIIAFALMMYQVFKGGLPLYVTRAAEKIPEILGLIVPISEVEIMKQKIRKPGTNESRLFDTVQEEAKKYNAEYRKTLRRRRR